MTAEPGICVVTGGSRGIGLETVRGLAQRGAHVVIVSRDRQTASSARDDVIATTGNERIELESADLSCQDEVRALAARLLARPQRLRVLLHNAAVASPTRRLSPDGIELQWAVNHLAPFLLTSLLTERLVTDAPARVVVVASRAHERGRIDFDDLGGERDYDGPRAYDQSKLANVLFTYELARRLAGTGVTANCLHPGVAPTRLNHYLRPRQPPGSLGLASRALALARRWRRRVAGSARPRAGTPAEASRTSVLLALSPQVEGVTGAYFVGGRPVPSAPATYDEDLAARLWAVSERWTERATSGGGAC